MTDSRTNTATATARAVLGAAAIALALAGCAAGSQQTEMSVLFDRPMVPEDVAQTLLRCGIHDGPREGPSLSIWLIPTGLGRSKLDCVRRQPHVEAVLGAR